MNLESWEDIFRKKIGGIASVEDPAHDELHFSRVVTMARELCLREGGQMEVVIPAAWLHDMVIVPKDSPLRNKASKMSAEEAVAYLRQVEYPEEYHKAIFHAVEGHSFSANIEVTSIEAMIVQDADRLDGLGAIGVARCFATAGMLKRAFYQVDDPFCEKRRPDDSQFTVDHFYKKLFKTAVTLKTESGRVEGLKRINTMKMFLSTLQQEIGEGSETH